MVGEVILFGRLLNVGENGRDVTPLYPPLVVDSLLDGKVGEYPMCWERVRNQRVVLRELEDRLRGRPEVDVVNERVAREGREEEAMRREARESGKVHPLGMRQGHSSQLNLLTSDMPQSQSLVPISEVITKSH